MVERLKYHALAVLFVLTAFSGTLALQALSSRAYYILFVPAVMCAAWFGGLGAGLTASLATVALTVVFLLPAGTVVDQLTWVAVAAVVAVATSTLVARRREAETRLAILLAQERSWRGQAESDSARKSAFLAQVAHELRQPLGAITTAARLLETNVAAATKDRAGRVIERQTEHLTRLVDDLLDLSRITRNELHLRRVDIDVCDVVEDCSESIQRDAAGRGVRFESSLPQCPVSMQADPTRLRQIVLNLLINAVKFTDAGGEVRLFVELQPAEVIIRVRDTGRGIAPDRLVTIFDMFQTGDAERSGLGVGLAVVKGLTEVHGGTVRATSPGPGRGSEFIVTLPQNLPRAAFGG